MFYVIFGAIHAVLAVMFAATGDWDRSISFALIAVLMFRIYDLEK
jgi:hypothetical protein